MVIVYSVLVVTFHSISSQQYNKVSQIKNVEKKHLCSTDGKDSWEIPMMIALNIIIICYPIRNY